MILTVTLNPAMDVTYTVAGLAPGQAHRVRTVAERPGGKGVNVARVLAAVGAPALAVGPGDDGFATLVAAYGVAAEFPSLLPRVRRTVTVVGPDSTTSFQEPGATAVPDAADRIERLIAGHLLRADVVVVSGSLAPGLPADLPARIAATAADHGIAAILDLDDEPLAIAAARGGSVLMPNHEELARLVGGLDDAPTAVAELSAKTGAPVVATMGAAGLLAAVDGTVWAATPPEPVAGNPTGAGDATAAAVALGLAGGAPWPALLADAVALGAAAVVAPVAGEVDLPSRTRWAPLVDVTRI